jgi:outer membrane protein assembly factor BamE (lipoprotein component of BamABCDE complex)
MKVTWIVLLISIAACDSPRSEENAENLKQIGVGMRIEEVEKIMGKPAKIIISPYEPNRYDFMYNAPFGMSDNFHIYISREDSTVISINNGQ